MGTLARFEIEHAYREHFVSGMVDLSSSSPQPLTARAVLEEAGIAPASLLDAPLEYEPAGGSREIRAAIASIYPGVAADDVLVTAGAAEAIRVAIEAAIQAGDTVVVQRPAYQALRAAAAARGAQIHDWVPRTGFQFDLATLPIDARDATSIILNNPHGPSGSTVLGTYGGFARLIADEVYRPASLVPGRRVPSVVDGSERAVSIGDLSKPLGLGGLRIGWIVSRDRTFLRECSLALDYFSGSVSALSAAVALAALARFDVHLDRHLVRARRNLRTLTTFVEDHSAWIEWTPPQAGYTAFLRLKAGLSAAAIVGRMSKRGVFLIDGAAFDAPGHLRIGFGRESVPFVRALDALGDELRAAAPSQPQSQSRDSDVIVLAKQPAVGLVKTRLAAGVGPERAAQLCSAFVRDSIDLASENARRLFIAASPPEALAEFLALAPHAHCFAQPDAPFGARLQHAFDTALAAGAQRPVLIGTDSPTLPSHLITVAHHALETHDIVLGPADDGGYYLIGMKAVQPSLFAAIDWSTERVLAQTLERADEAGLTVFVLPPWYDIDTARDLERLSADPLLRVHTREALRSHHLAEVAI